MTALFWHSGRWWGVVQSVEEQIQPFSNSYTQSVGDCEVEDSCFKILVWTKLGNGKVSRHLQSTAKIPLSKVVNPQKPHVEPCSELVAHSWEGGGILPLPLWCWDRLQHPVCDPRRVKGVKNKKEEIVTYCLEESRVRGLLRTPKVCLNSWQPSWMSRVEKEMTPFFCESWDAASHRGSGSPRNAADSEELWLKCSKTQTALSHIKED